MIVFPSTAAPTVTPSSTVETSAATTTSSKGLGQHAFLKLLIAQLQNQDPTRPQDNGAFITQLATFRSLEKLSDIDTSLNTLIQLVASKSADGTAGGTN